MASSFFVLLLSFAAAGASSGSADQLVLPSGLQAAAAALAPAPNASAIWTITASQGAAAPPPPPPPRRAAFSNATACSPAEKKAARDAAWTLLGRPVQLCCDDLDCDNPLLPQHPGDCDKQIKCGAPCPEEPVDGLSPAALNPLGSFDTCKKRAPPCVAGALARPPASPCCPLTPIFVLPFCPAGASCACAAATACASTRAGASTGSLPEAAPARAPLQSATPPISLFCRPDRHCFFLSCTPFAPLSLINTPQRPVSYSVRCEGAGASSGSANARGLGGEGSCRGKTGCPSRREGSSALRT